MCRAKGCKEGCVASCCDNDALSDVIMPCLAHTKDAEFVDGKLIYAPFYLTNYMYTPVFFLQKKNGWVIHTTTTPITNKLFLSHRHKGENHINRPVYVNRLDSV